MSVARRSGRIPKELPILILGTDTAGRVFSEQTHTLVLSRHGAGILSRNKFAPDEVLTLRLLESGREAEVRLVGQLGEHPRGNVYGVAFSDPQLDFWQIEFPPAEDYLAALPVADLECCFCGEQDSGRQSEIESDVFLASRLVLRFCKSCGQTTSWKLATQKKAPPKPVASSPSANALHETAPPPIAAAVPPAPQRSAYAASTILSDIVSTSAYASGHVAAQSVAAATLVKESARAPKTAALPPPAFSGGGKANRRRHVRTRVHFTACVRVNHLHEEIVECDNISKGGLCFRSQKRYEENAAIEVAVPYSPGQPAIFTPARIRRVEEIPALNLFRYGVAYA